MSYIAHQTYFFLGRNVFTSLIFFLLLYHISFTYCFMYLIPIPKKKNILNLNYIWCKLCLREYSTKKVCPNLSPSVSSRMYSVHTENNEQLIIIIIIIIFNLYVHAWVRIESKSFARILDIIITRLQ